MSRSIKIPEYKNPFIVVINNNVYQYKGGETVEVPDEVADAIEDALELVPKPKRYLSKFAQRAEGSLEEITVEDLRGVSTISHSAFVSCENLRKVSLHNGINTIRNYAFNWCSNLESVWLPEIPPTLVHTNAFDNVKADCVFYCKTQASLDAYKAATNWSTLTGSYSFVVEE